MNGIFGEAGEKMQSEMKREQLKHTTFHFVVSMVLFQLHERVRKGGAEEKTVDEWMLLWRDLFKDVIKEELKKEEVPDFMGNLFGIDLKAIYIDTVDEVYEMLKKAVHSADPSPPKLEWIPGKKREE